MNLLHVVLSMCESRSSFPTLNWLALPERSGNSFEWRCQRAGKELNINAQKFYCLDIFFFFNISQGFVPRVECRCSSANARLLFHLFRFFPNNQTIAEWVRFVIGKTTDCFWVYTWFDVMRVGFHSHIFDHFLTKQQTCPSIGWMVHRMDFLYNSDQHI